MPIRSEDIIFSVLALTLQKMKKIQNIFTVASSARN